MRRSTTLSLLRLGIPEQSRSQRLLWYAAALLGVALTTLAIGLARPYVRPERLQIGYLLVVLAVAIGGGSGPALFASLLAFLAYDWFFVSPVGTPAIASPAEWLALLLFVAVAISTGSLAAGLKRSGDEARKRSHELAVLYALSQAVLASRRGEQLLDVIVERLREALHLPAAAIVLVDSDGRLQLAASTGLSETFAGECDAALAGLGARGERTSSVAAALGDVAAGHALHAACRPLALSDHSLGLLVALTPAGMQLAGEAARVLDAFAAQTAIAIDRARLAEEEQRARAAAESDRLKSIFLASLSHDLRTPLTAIKAAAGVLASELTSASAGEALAGIDDEVDRLNRLLGNLLDLSRIEGGGLLLRPEPESLEEIVGATVERLAPLFVGRQIVLRAAALPLLALDATQIERVLVNLLENAARFSPPGSAITVELSRDAEQAIVRVHNLGAAIPAGEQQRIFEKLYRLNGATRLVDGAGLGLAICKGIAEAHQGRVWTRNEQQGVAFYLALPLPAAATIASAVGSGVS